MFDHTLNFSSTLFIVVRSVNLINVVIMILKKKNPICAAFEFYYNSEISGFSRKKNCCDLLHSQSNFTLQIDLFTFQCIAFAEIQL